MTTVVEERSDALADLVPGCEETLCDRPAAWYLEQFCGCSMLICQRCLDMWKRLVASKIGIATCQECRRSCFALSWSHIVKREVRL